MSEDKRRILTLLKRLYAAIKSTNKNVSSIKEDNMVLLWENSSPSSAFAAQTIALDLKDYNWVKIESMPYAGRTTQVSTNEFQCPGAGDIFAPTTRTDIGGSGWWHGSRTVSITTTGITFGSGGYRYSNATSAGSGDAYGAPLRIWGLKKSYSVSLVKDVLPAENGGTGVTSLEELKSKLGVISGGGSGGGGPLTLSDSRLLQTYLGLRNKELWSGDEWKSGSKTIPGISNYEKLLVFLWDGYNGIELDRVGTNMFRGGGFASHVSSDTKIHTDVVMDLKFTEDDVVTIEYASLAGHITGGAHQAATDGWAIRIVGVEPTAEYVKEKLGISDTTIENGKVKFAPVKIENKVLLWKNPKPSEAFAGQTISVPGLTDYDSYSIVFKSVASETVTNEDFFTSKDSGGYIRMILNNGKGRRYFTKSGSNLTLSDASYVANGSSSTSATNTYIVPIAIYGIKNNPTVNIPTIDISSAGGLGGNITFSDSRLTQKYLALKNKTLWTGDIWNSGTKTISGISNYNTLLCKIDLGNSSCVLNRRTETTFQGSCNVPYDSWVATAAIELTIDGNNTTISQWEWLANTASSNHGVINKTYGVKEIVGVEPTEAYVKNQLELDDTEVSEDGTIKFKPVDVESRTLLWTNPNPTVAFDGQTIDIPWQDYDSVCVEYAYNKASDSHMDSTTVTCTTGNSGHMDYLYLTSTGASRGAERSFSLVDTGIYFKSGWYGAASNSAAAVNQEYIIPIKVYGIKNKVTVDIPKVNLSNFSGATVDPDKVITLKDYIVDEGTSGIWTYRKWNSGIAECWGRATNTTTLSTAWGSTVYTGVLLDKLAYPFEFADIPNEVVRLEPTNSSGWIYGENGTTTNVNTTTHTGKYMVARPSSVSATTTVKADIFVKGYWKALESSTTEVAAVKENTARLSIDMDGYEKSELVWTNPDPTTNFGTEKTITLDLSKYDKVRITHRTDYWDGSTEVKDVLESTEIDVGSTGVLTHDGMSNTSTYYVMSKQRAVTVSTTGVTFKVPYVSHTTSGPVVDGSACIPYQIYGIQTTSKLEGTVTGDNVTLDIGVNKAADLNPDTLIPSGADLNDYTEPGSYLSPSGTISGSLSNCPVTKTGFNLQVMQTTTGGVKQFIIDTSTNANIFARRINLQNSTFYDWLQMGTTVVEKVWENAKPTSDFAAQTVKVSLTEYDMILVKMKYTKSSASYSLDILKVGEKGVVFQMAGAKAASVSYLSRDVSVTTSGVEFGDGYGKTIFSSSAGSSNASNLIPVEIYGVKGVL